MREAQNREAREEQGGQLTLTCPGLVNRKECEGCAEAWLDGQLPTLPWTCIGPQIRTSPRLLFISPTTLDSS